jgi:hypothetical protein
MVRIAVACEVDPGIADLPAELNVEFFNIFNRVQFAPPRGSLQSLHD